MSVLTLVFYPDARLAQPCATVGGDDLSGLISNMFDTMYAAPGRGLAGPQVGVMKRIFVMDCTWKEGAKTPMAFLDPEIIAASAEKDTLDEGCLSIPGLMVPVVRSTEITVRWKDAHGTVQELKFRWVRGPLHPARNGPSGWTCHPRPSVRSGARRHSKRI